MFKFFFAVVYVSIAGLSCKSPVSMGENKSPSDTSSIESEDSTAADSLAVAYGFNDLKTDFSKHSIPLDSIRDGGPAKNGIPAIDFPEFISIEQSARMLADADFGILLQGKEVSKFYPFNILNWHEIINDDIDGLPVAVTFCPLCGSAIVFERVVKNDTLDFGVSGKLYESNLLMFDDKTESLWLQGLGEAVVGTYTGEKLKILSSAITSFEDVKKYFPSARVLSPHTGFVRNYSQHPYADYLATEELYFPVSHKSDRFEPKDIVLVVQQPTSSIAFNWLTLLKKGKATVHTPEGTVTVSVSNAIPIAMDEGTGTRLPSYFSFWFSWYTLHGMHGTVWDE